MTRRTAPPPSDLLDADGSELHALYREGSAGEPGAMLDQSILAAARAELRSASARPTRRPRWKAWLKPASAVAVAVLGLSLSWQLSDQQERDRRQEMGSTNERLKAAAGSDQGAVAQPPRASAPVRKAQAPAAAAPPPATYPVAPAEPQAFPAQDQAKSKTGIASGAVARSAPAQSATAMPAEKKNLGSDATAAPANSVRSEAADAGSGSAPGKFEFRRRADGAAGEDDALGKSADAAATPQAWLKQIRELRTAGRDAEAAQSLSCFRVHYPDFVVPADLANLK